MKLLGIYLSCACLILSSSAGVTKHAGRIIGGNEAFAGQYPFATAIYVQTATSKFFCGGALLSNLWVVTAAHCVSGSTLLTIQLGSTHLQGVDSNRQTVATESVVLHPLYDPNTLENDVAVILFRLPVILTDYIGPVSFFPNNDLTGSAPVTTLGWGQISDSVAGVTNILRYVRLTTLSHSECTAIFGSQIKPTMICVDGNYNEGTCNGDSGAPLIQEVAGGHSVLIGIANFISTNGCESTDPSGFTRIFPYKIWIHNVTGIPL